jgi:hypothetical protein
MKEVFIKIHKITLCNRIYSCSCDKHCKNIDIQGQKHSKVKLNDASNDIYTCDRKEYQI